MRKKSLKYTLFEIGQLHSASRGFTLIELMIAMAIGMLLLGAMYSVFTVQNKTLTNQEEVVAMQQSVRAGMDMMIMEVGMAGYNPAGATCDGITVNSSQLQIQADLNGDGAIDATSQENIIYTFDSANYQITRNIGAGPQQFVENVQSFTFAYLNGSGTVTTLTDDVRSIRLMITGRTAKRDPNYTVNGGYRTYTLTSVVTPRNLAY